VGLSNNHYFTPFLFAIPYKYGIGICVISRILQMKTPFTTFHFFFIGRSAEIMNNNGVGFTHPTKSAFPDATGKETGTTVWRPAKEHFRQKASTKCMCDL